MKTASLKLAAGLVLSIATLGQDVMAEVKPTYRNMNLPIVSCQISEESRKSEEAAGITALPKLDVIVDYEAAFLLYDGSIPQSKAMVIYSGTQADPVTGSTINSVLTGSLRKDGKAGWIFTSDEILYDEKFVSRETVVISSKDNTAKVGSKTYKCKTALTE